MELNLLQSDDSDVYEDFKAGLKSEESKKRSSSAAAKDDPKLCSKRVRVSLPKVDGGTKKRLNRPSEAVESDSDSEYEVEEVVELCEWYPPDFWKSSLTLKVRKQCLYPHFRGVEGMGTSRMTDRKGLVYDQFGTLEPGSQTGGNKGCENLCFYSDCPLVLLLFSLSFSVYPTSLVWHSWSGPFLEPVCLSVSPWCSYPFYFLATRIQTLYASHANVT